MREYLVHTYLYATAGVKPSRLIVMRVGMISIEIK